MQISYADIGYDIVEHHIVYAKMSYPMWSCFK